MFNAAEYDRRRAADARRKAGAASSERERLAYLELAEIFEHRAVHASRTRH